MHSVYERAFRTTNNTVYTYIQKICFETNNCSPQNQNLNVFMVFYVIFYL